MIRPISPIRPILLLLGILLALHPAVAEDLTLRDGTKYTGITISRVFPDGISIITSEGITKIPFTALPDDIQKRYHYQPAAAAAYRQAVAQRTAADNAQANAILARDIATRHGIDPAASTTPASTSATTSPATTPIPVIDNTRGGLKKLIALTADQIATSPYTLQGALVKMTSWGNFTPKEKTQGLYEITIWTGDKFLYATLPLAETALAEKSNTLYVSVTDPEEPRIQIHGNAIRHDGLNVMPTVYWKP